MIIVPPYRKLGASHGEWTRIEISPWLLRQLRFGLQLPWISFPNFSRILEYKLDPEHKRFSQNKVAPWIEIGYVRIESRAESSRVIEQGSVSPAFVTNTSKKFRLVIDCSGFNEFLEDRTFRMDELADLAAVMRPRNCFLKAEMNDAFYHLRMRSFDREMLAFMIGGVVYPLLCLHFVLSVSPWFFKKAMEPVVDFFRAIGHRAFSYLNDFSERLAVQHYTPP